MKGTFGAAALALALAACSSDGDSDPPSPAAPTALWAVSASNGQIDLSWTDASTTESGFQVERSSDGINFTWIADAPADAAAAAVTGLAPSTTYFFRVRAYGYKSASAWSNVASTTTDPVSWTPLAPAGTIPSRYHHAAVFQPGLRMIVFGGAGAAPYNDTWELDLSMPPLSWTEITPVPSPTWREGHAAVYDSPNQRMIVFGGIDENWPASNGVLALDLSGTPAWSTLLPPDSSPAIPVARFDHSLVYDSASQRAILFGGNEGGGVGLNDVWALSLSGPPAWTRITTVGAPPPVRYLHSAVYDAANERMIVFGGIAENLQANDLWALSLSGAPIWTRLTPAGIPPSARSGHAAVYDSLQRRMFVFGGENGNMTNPLMNDLWVLTLDGPIEWRPVFAAGAPPSPRVGHSAVYDPGSQSMILFGGWDGMGTINSEAWSLGL